MSLTKNINHETLKVFCSTDPDRPAIHEPWIDSGKTYATDGCMVIQIDRITDGCNDGQIILDASIISKIFAECDFSGNRIAVPNNLQKTRCTKCSGRAVFVCPNCDHHCDCRKCNGTGTIYSNIILPDGRKVAGKYLARIADLPGVMICEGKTDGVGFVFDGGRGVIMSIQQF